LKTDTAVLDADDLEEGRGGDLDEREKESL